MIVHLKLSPEEVTALRDQATAADVDLEAILHRLIAPLVEHAAQKTASERVRVDLGPADSEAQAERAQEQAEMLNNIRRWREEQRAGEQGR